MTFDTGNNQDTSVADAYAVTNDNFANIGRLDDIFGNVYYEHLFGVNTCRSTDDSMLCVDDIIKRVKDIDVHKSSGIDFLPIFILKDC